MAKRRKGTPDQAKDAMDQARGQLDPWGTSSPPGKVRHVADALAESKPTRPFDVRSKAVAKDL